MKVPCLVGRFTSLKKRKRSEIVISYYNCKYRQLESTSKSSSLTSNPRTGGPRCNDHPYAYHPGRL